MSSFVLPAQAYAAHARVPAGRVIWEFERRTGVGAVLNTSFNLHGGPLVASAEDAVDTFERSGPPHLALDRFLISKK